MARITLIAALIIVCGCGPSVTSLEDLKPLVHSLQTAEIFEIYEGLPHQNLDPKLFEDELESKPTITFGGFPFYVVPLDLAEEDCTDISELFGDVESFVPHDLTSARACGGFHPDYCLTWQVGSNNFHALLCFGCSEVKAAGGRLELHLDIQENAREDFLMIFESYRKNRPERQL